MQSRAGGPGFRPRPPREDRQRGCRALNHGARSRDLSSPRIGGARFGDTRRVGFPLPLRGFVTCSVSVAGCGKTPHGSLLPSEAAPRSVTTSHVARPAHSSELRVIQGLITRTRTSTPSGHFFRPGRELRSARTRCGVQVGGSYARARAETVHRRARVAVSFGVRCRGALGAGAARLAVPRTEACRAGST